MSFGLPSLKPELETIPGHGLKKNNFGVHDSLAFGLKNVKGNIQQNHPLELSEKNYDLKEWKMQMTILRNTQGLHAPIKLGAELWAAKQVGRLPFMESSGLATATIKSTDDMLDFTDILSLPEQDEHLLMPHVVMEHKLGIL
ncbi:proteasome maturation protein [Cimex lectularius]|uniref:Proteasome maturation protein n=1 Tax=Cimex lectularius TaxID=79782 RepID=A0A8I6THD4_CIMLE|nr:proteasome maturation protein [Cimex lectularius]